MFCTSNCGLSDEAALQVPSDLGRPMKWYTCKSQKFVVSFLEDVLSDKILKCRFQIFSDDASLEAFLHQQKVRRTRKKLLQISLNFSPKTNCLMFWHVAYK